MKIVKLEDGKNGKNFVYLEDSTVFPIGKKECRNLELKEEKELSKEQLEWIFRELVFMRGRNYLIHLLASRDYTVKEIEDKLRKARYPDFVIEEIISYGIEKHYLDDLRYAEDYIRFRKGSKSIRQLKYQLSLKGISDDVLNQMEEDDDRKELEQQILKYRDKKSGSDFEKDAKTYQHFVRKGYNSGIIKELLRNISYK